mmetsp:Transcript_13445/g.47400  ORF Transcript_13445/g.47400 Transcript_13445/m.47400 type:complete len:462 (+) Transcript_13445:92-1477(+)
MARAMRNGPISILTPRAQIPQPQSALPPLQTPKVSGTSSNTAHELLTSRRREMATGAAASASSASASSSSAAPPAPGGGVVVVGSGGGSGGPTKFSTRRNIIHFRMDLSTATTHTAASAAAVPSSSGNPLHASRGLRRGGPTGGPANGNRLLLPASTSGSSSASVTAAATQALRARAARLHTTQSDGASSGRSATLSTNATLRSQSPRVTWNSEPQGPISWSSEQQGSVRASVDSDLTHSSEGSSDEEESAPVYHGRAKTEQSMTADNIERLDRRLSVEELDAQFEQALGQIAAPKTNIEEEIQDRLRPSTPETYAERVDQSSKRLDDFWRTTTTSNGQVDYLAQALEEMEGRDRRALEEMEGQEEAEALRKEQIAKIAEAAPGASDKRRWASDASADTRLQNSARVSEAMKRIRVKVMALSAFRGDRSLWEQPAKDTRAFKSAGTSSSSSSRSHPVFTDV